MKTIKRLPKRRARDAGFPFGGLGAGGLVNYGTGLGTRFDKNEGMFYEPARVTTRTELEVLYAQSWACKAFIDYPVDDMFIRWREFEDTEEDVVDALEDQERKFHVTERLARSMKAGKLYGTGLLVAMTAEEDLRKPLDIRKMRPGDLKNLLAIDRFDAWVIGRESNPWSQRYGSASAYGINLKNGGSLQVHASRVIRFDGQYSLSMTGWQNYEQDWGVSEVLPLLTSMLTEESTAKSTGHMVQQSLIDVFKIQGYEDALSGVNAADGELTLSQRAEAITLAKSIYRSIFMDSEDSFERHEYTFTGLAEVMDRQAKRLAAGAKIPATRFYGQSPLGLNATGEGDMVNYALQVNADQNKKLKHPLFFLDQLLLANAGMLGAEVHYRFPSLIDSSDEDQANVLGLKMKAASDGVAAGILTENEARNILDGDPLIGPLEDIEMPEADLPVPVDQPEKVAEMIGDALPFGAFESNGRIMFRAPATARKNAEKVLRWKEEHGDDVKGMTQVGWTRANQLAKNEPLSPDTVARMASFARHEKNAVVDPKHSGEPWKDAGYVAWLGWGGKAGITWAKRAHEWYKSRK